MSEHLDENVLQTGQETFVQALRQRPRAPSPEPRAVSGSATGARPDWVVLALLMVGAWLLLWNLGNGYLWQDEAETALLARRALQFGYLRAFDGRNLIEEPIHGVGPGEAWVYAPWLPFYLLAGVFLIAGESETAARLPFALLGWLNLCFTWRLAKRLTADRRIQRLAVALLVCSVPFLLHMRQCRYYAPTTSLVLGTCLAYLAFLRRPTLLRSAALGGVLVLLFHTNCGAFVPTTAAIILHHLRWGCRGVRPLLLVAGAGLLSLTLPWAFMMRTAAYLGTLSLERIADHLEYYVRAMNKSCIPLAFMGIASILLVVQGPRPRPVLPGPDAPVGVRLLFLLVACHAAFALIPDQRHLRYLIPTLPLLAIGEAWWFIAWLGRVRRLASAALALALFTTVLQSTHLRLPLIDFVDELTHRYTGPMEGIVAYLRANGRASQVVKIPYDDRTLMFYTDLTIERPSAFLQESYPDWIVIRRDWIPEAFFTSPYLHRIASTYDRIDLAAPDTRWQNREDPGEHHFRTVQDAPRVVVYRKREEGHDPA